MPTILGRGNNGGATAMVRAASAVILLLLMATVAEAQSRRSSDKSSAQARTFRDCAGCPEMVLVPAGEFLMGSPESERGRGKDEGPRRTVTFAQPFAVGKFEVTFAEWDACAADNGCKHKPEDQGWGRGKKPVINVSWSDAREYVAWLARKSGKPYRLLTEAEWEYAARGVTKATDPHTAFSTGPTIGYKQANYDANFVYGKGQQGVYRQKTTDVGAFPRNAFGLHDMHGNVWEWVEDCYRDSYSGAPMDGSAVKAATCDLRILRGGSWNYYPRLLRSAYRYASAPGIRMENVGFRVARAM
jgi:formylglycine-generating enzyme required for sulfatase activity